MRLCLFAAHLRPGNRRLDAEQTRFVTALALQFERVVVLLASDDAGASAAISWVLDGHSNNVSIVPVPNMNLDFGAWARAVPLLSANPPEVLALVNDSCILRAPTAPAGDPGAACWGLVKSYEITEHLQSFYLVFRGKSAVSAVIRFFDSVSGWLLSGPMPKNDVIHACEIGISRFLLASGLRLDAAFDPKTDSDLANEMRARRPGRIAPSNLSYSFWDLLLERGCPLLKLNRESLGPRCTSAQECRPSS